MPDAKHHPMFPPLKDLARRLLASGPHKTAPTSRRVRAVFNGRYILDTTRALHVWEHPYFPQFYVPLADFADGCWRRKEDVGGEEGAQEKARGKGEGGAFVVAVKVGDKETDRAIGFAEDVRGEASVLAGLCKVEFGAVGEFARCLPSLYGETRTQPPTTVTSLAD